MRVGDLVVFKKGYTGIIVGHCDFSDAVRVWINEDVPFTNPTFMSIKLLNRSITAVHEATPDP